MIGINIKLFLIIASLFVHIKSNTKTSSIQSDNDICTTKESCVSCIRTHDCVWCGENRNLSDSTLNSIPRCENKKTVNKKGGRWCKEEKIVVMESYTHVSVPLEFSQTQGKQVQVKPQRVKMRLRPGDEQKLKVEYRQAEDYPVDLYFLMDLSASMEDHRNRLSGLGKSLANALSNITSNFHLGFGSFVDKVVLPMTNTQEEWTHEGSCKLKDRKTHCAPPYGYKNQMPLTSDKSQFENQVMHAPISGNIDSPEGGLDALMQAMVCWKEIGWRDSARHLLVFSTDAKYHIAGDGRLAGIIEPNDERCHLNETNFYTHAELLDYPSLAQIKTVAKDSGIYIIFAVTENVLEDYRLLSEYLPTASIGKLDEKSDTVVKLVSDEYKKLMNTVKMTHNTTSKIDVKTMTNCANSSQPLKEKSECNNVRVNEVFEFEYTIKAIDCPDNPEDWLQTITIKPEGVNETVIIEVELVCDCPCSRPKHEEYVSNSSECTSNGDLTCGVCSCKKGYYGKQCLCTDDRTRNIANTPGACVANNTSNEKVCSGRGRCICDECKCNPRPIPGEHYYGTYCECDNFSCDRFNDMVCGGPEHGTCECGVCKCSAGFEGKSCGCSSSKATCLPQVDNAVECNGFGECVCGECRCDPAKGRTGSYCEICSTCPSQYCDELKDCVECLVHKAGVIFDENNSCGGCGARIDLADFVDNLNETLYDESNHVCTMPDATGCTFMFQYSDPIRGDTGNSRTVTAEKDKKCPLPPVSAFGVAGAAIGLTLFLGLLGLLGWKVLTMIHDHREFVKFEKERVRATYQGGTNPIFKEPTSTFKNPMFENQEQSTKS